MLLINNQTFIYEGLFISYLSFSIWLLTQKKINNGKALLWAYTYAILYTAQIAFRKPIILQ